MAFVLENLALAEKWDDREVARALRRCSRRYRARKSLVDLDSVWLGGQLEASVHSPAVMAELTVALGQLRQLGVKRGRGGGRRAGCLFRRSYREPPSLAQRTRGRS